ncbi:MAG: hypothetical protein ACFB15_06385 [Cyclobacteriaceae bacterium]
MKTILIFIVLLICTSCASKVKEKDENRIPVLRADREAPIGWVYLDLYQDNSFDLKFGRRDKPKTGTYTLSNDTIYFQYDDEIDFYRSKGVINDKWVCFQSDSLKLMRDRDCTDRVEIKLNKLITEN